MSSLQKEHRGIIYIDGFYEEDKDNNLYYFYFASKRKIAIPVTYVKREKSYQFAILTKASRYPVETVQSRQPVMLGMPDKWSNDCVCVHAYEILIKKPITNVTT